MMLYFLSDELNAIAQHDLFIRANSREVLVPHVCQFVAKKNEDTTLSVDSTVGGWGGER